MEGYIYINTCIWLAIFPKTNGLFIHGNRDVLFNSFVNFKLDITVTLSQVV